MTDPVVGDSDDDKGVIICTRVVHNTAFLAIGSVVRECVLCHEPIWVAPSSFRVVEDHVRHGATAEFRCCCCVGTHSPAEFRRLAATHTLHMHKFDPFSGTCSCGLTRDELRKEFP